MNRKIFRDRLLTILDQSPELKKMFISTGDIETRRRQIKSHLSFLLGEMFDSQPEIPPLEWVTVRDAIGVFRNLLSSRSEKLSGFSLIGYVDDLINRPDGEDPPAAAEGFLSELDNLIRGIAGRADIYEEELPEFLKHEGVTAARLRSADLSRMARAADGYLRRYACGLDSDALRRRYKNRVRILDFFGATDYEWDRWKWHLRHIVRDPDTLSRLIQLNRDEYDAIALARANGIPFGITPYYLSLMDFKPSSGTGLHRDSVIRAQVIPSLKSLTTLLEKKQGGETDQDFMLERNTSPVEGITRRYPKIVIFKPIKTCPQICAYCQRNWEIEEVDSQSAVLSGEAVEKAVEWIRETPEISEVLITGGDPMMLGDRQLERLLSGFARIPHIERIRIGTRMLVTLPQRVTDTLARAVNRFHIPGKREIVIVTHFEHPYEITPEAMRAVQKFRGFGIDVYNQMVYTFYNSRKFEAVALRNKLRLIGVTPYYTFNTKGKEETGDFRVPIPRLMQEQKEEARLFPGTLRTDEIVFNVPGLGKNYLRANQHHDIIAITPDGRRVYEFHPWEKKLSLMDTYVYTDVSIHEYLGRLKAAGEDPADYKSIWFYY